MKRALIVVAGVLLVAVVGVIAVVAYVVDAESLRAQVVGVASESLGRRVELGELDLVFFPAPAVRLQGVKVEGDRGAPTLLTVEEVRLRIALAPLLQGRVVLAAVDLDGPAIRLPVDREGRPVLPELPDARPTSTAPPSKTARAPSGGDSEEPPAPASAPARVAIESLALSGGSVEVGPWRLSGLDVRGNVALDGVSELRFGAQIDGLGAIEDGRAELRELGSEAPAVELQAALRGLDLEVLAERLALAPEPLARLAGQLSGTLAASLRGDQVAEASVDLAIEALELDSSDARVTGRVPIRAALGGPLEVDLGAAEVRSGDLLRKPAGDALRVRGTLGRELGPAALQALTLVLGPNEVPIRPELAAGRLQIGPCKLDLAPLAPWLDLEGRTLAGVVDIDRPLRLTLEPLGAQGQLRLVGIEVSVEQGVARLQGPVVARGEQVRFDGLEVALGGQTVRVNGGYDLAKGALDLDVGVEEAEVQPLLLALAGSSNVTGILGAGIGLRGPPSLEGLRGSGKITIAPGQIQDFSLLRQLLGPLAATAEQILRSKGKDLSRYEDERFERLEGDFALAGGTVQLRSLVLAYQYGRAEFKGSIGLLGDQRLALVGTVTLPPEVASDLLGRETDQPLTLPDVAIGGTLDTPKVQLDAALLTRIIAQVAAQEGVRVKLGENLEKAVKEKLGGSDADVEAVKGLLEGILGGGKGKP